MDITKIRKLSTVERFVYWINERESVHKAKETGKPKPWTDDPILQRFKFCNVVRMDDRVSQWLLHNWYEPNYGHKNMLLACAFARFINKPEVLEEIGFPTRWSPNSIYKKLLDRKAQGLRCFNSAYIVTGGNRGDKICSVVYDFVSQLKGVQRTLPTDSVEKSCLMLQEFNGIGSFMAGQIIADMRWAVDGEWKDRKRWAPMGPGSRRGMNRILGRALRAPIKQKEFLYELGGLMSVNGVPTSLRRRMEAIDWQNCLCEFDKYERAVWRERPLKRKYNGLS